jgi:hypothetical protein
VAWGGLHGGYLVVHRLWSRISWRPFERWRATAAWKWMSRILLFHAVCLGWVFFRSSTFALAFSVLGQLRVPGAATLATGPVLIVLFLGLAGQWMPARWRNGFEVEMGRWPALARGAAIAVAIAAIELLGPTGVAPFIYFQF